MNCELSFNRQTGHEQDWDCHWWVQSLVWHIFQLNFIAYSYQNWNYRMYPLNRRMCLPPVPYKCHHNSQPWLMVANFRRMDMLIGISSTFFSWDGKLVWGFRSGTATPEVALEMDDAAFSGKREQVTFTCMFSFIQKVLIKFSASFLARKKHAGAPESDVQPLLSRNNDRDADSEHNKYKRRPAREWLRGIWKYALRSFSYLSVHCGSFHRLASKEVCTGFRVAVNYLRISGRSMATLHLIISPDTNVFWLLRFSSFLYW